MTTTETIIVAVLDLVRLVDRDPDLVLVPDPDPDRDPDPDQEVPLVTEVLLVMMTKQSK